jgi:hypothetical protein
MLGNSSPIEKSLAMNCEALAARIQQCTPDAGPGDIARLCLLLSNAIDDISELQDDDRLRAASHEMKLRLEAASDQHAAMVRELEDLAQSDPSNFEPDQVWTLIRAIKVQSQILQLYLGEPALDV